MSDAGALGDLYQELIMDHNRSPRNFGDLPGADHAADGHNPLCGDSLHLGMRLDGDRIDAVAWKGVGCAISKSSASLMTEAVKGKTLAEAQSLYGRFHDLVTKGGDGADLGKLRVFAGVGEYPARVKCATLAWRTLEAALRDGGTVSTE